LGISGISFAFSVQQEAHGCPDEQEGLGPDLLGDLEHAASVNKRLARSVEAGLLNSKAVPPSSKSSQVSRGRDTYTNVRDGTGIWLRDAAASRLVSVRCVTLEDRSCEWWRASCVPPQGACMLLRVLCASLATPISSIFHSDAFGWV
jgi:hypothetical protein